MKRLILAFAAAMLLAAGCSGKSSSPPSFETAMKLHEGQTYEQVVQIMGKPDKIDASGVEWYWGTDWGTGNPAAAYKTPRISVRLTNGLVSYINIQNIDAPK